MAFGDSGLYFRHRGAVVAFRGGRFVGVMHVGDHADPHGQHRGEGCSQVEQGDENTVHHADQETPARHRRQAGNLTPFAQPL